jgi:hypothetical protein
LPRAAGPLRQPEATVRDKLAEKLFAKVMGQDSDGPDYLNDYAAPLQALASHKYDEYGGYRPGVKFMETLAGWLDQLETEERRVALDFVLERLIFVSNAELDHAISVAYRDLVRPRLLERVAAEEGLQHWHVSRTGRSPAFARLERQLLVLGLADGARLDRFRRNNPRLVHAQFAPSPLVDERNAQDLVRALAEAQDDRDSRFRHVLLVDDFSGSGFTMLRPEGTGWGGKLAKFQAHLERLEAWGVVSSDVAVSIVLYVASQQAVSALQQGLAATTWGWTLDVVQTIPDDAKVRGEAFEDLCLKYHDPVFDDEIKKQAGDTSALGFSDGRLPLVLPHNTPNNSVSLLWADSTDGRPDGLGRRALFPRFERHRADRR